MMRRLFVTAGKHLPDGLKINDNIINISNNNILQNLNKLSTSRIELDRIVDHLITHGTGDEIKWNKEIENFSKYGKIGSVQYLFSVMGTKGRINLTKKHVHLYLQACNHAKDSITAYEYLLETNISLLDSIAYKTSLQISGDSGDPITGEKILDLMRLRNIPIDIIHYNYILNAYAETKNIDQIVETIQEMQKNDKIQPNIGSYNILLKACSKASNFDKAMYYFQQIKLSKNLLMDKYTWSQIVQAATSTGHLAEAKELISEMLDQKKGYNLLTPYVFNHILKAISYGTDINTLNEMFKLMRSYSIRPDIISYQYALSMTSKLNNKEKTKELLKQLLQEGAKLNTTVWRLVISPFSRSLDCEGIKEIMSIIRNSFHVMECSMWRDLIIIYGRKSMLKEAEQTLHDMKVIDNIEPTVECYQSVIRAYTDNNQPQKAYEILCLLRSKGSVPGLDLWQTVLVSWASDSKSETVTLDILHFLTEMITLDKRIPTSAFLRQIFQHLYSATSSESSVASVTGENGSPSATITLLVESTPVLSYQQIKQFISKFNTEVQYSLSDSFLHALCTVNDINTAFLFVQTIAPTSSLTTNWNEVLHKAIEVDNTNIVTSLLALMQSRSIVIDTTTAEQLLKYYTINNEIEKAMAFSQLLIAEYNLNTALTNRMLELFVTIPDKKRFHDLMSTMHSRNIPLNQNTYLLWLKMTSISSKSIPESLQVIDAMFASGITQCDVTLTYSPLIDIGIANKDWYICDLILSHIRGHLMQPSVELLRKYMTALTRYHRIMKAIDLLEQCYKSQNKLGIIVNSTDMLDICSCILEECALRGFAEDALWFAERMRGMELRPNSKCWGFIIRALCMSDRVDEACDAIHDMRLLDGQKAVASNYDPIFEVCERSQNNNKALDMLYDMREQNITPSIQHFESILKSLITKQPDLAIQLLYDMVNTDKTLPSMRAYLTVFEHFCTTDQPSLVIDLLQFMNRNGQKPDRHIFSVIEQMRRYDVVLEGIQMS